MMLDTIDEAPELDELPQDGAAGDQDEPPELDDASEDEDGEGAEDSGEADEDGEVTITLGDDAPDEFDDDELNPKARASWAEMRVNLAREKKARQQLEQQLSASVKAPPILEVGQEPSMDDPGIDYDADIFREKYREWMGRKSAVDKAHDAERDRAEQERIKWSVRVADIEKAADSLKIKDSVEASVNFEEAFSPMQQGIILGAPDDPKVSAMLRYVLGKNSKVAAQLKSITDPVKFTWAVSKLEDKLKTTSRKSAPTPERVIKSTTSSASAVSNHANRLRDDARKTGDYSKVIEYRRQQDGKVKK